MINFCENITHALNRLRRFNFPYDEQKIPLNGVYVLFQKGEIGHGCDRIVRVGTHTGKNQLRSRLRQHFTMENKDRSIFRKNIGRALLNRRNDQFLEFWEVDRTTKANKDKYRDLIDLDYQRKIEEEVTNYIRENFSFVIIPVEEKDERLELESRLISTVSLCETCNKSNDWLGNYSPKKKIARSGLWLVNELYKIPFDEEDAYKLMSFLN